MLFVVAIFFALFFEMLFCGVELRGRRLKRLRPSNFREVVAYSQKKIAAHPRYPALMFAVVIVFSFQIWEAFLRFLIQRESRIEFFSLGVVVVCTAMAMRAKRLYSTEETDLRLGRYTLVALSLGFSILLSAWMSLLLLPWIYFRVRFLPKRFG